VRGEPFAVLLADDLMIGEPPIMQQMTELFAEHQCSILAVQEVPRNQTNRYGIVKGKPLSADLVNIEELIEKPHPSVAPSNLAVAGRYVLTPAVFDQIREQPRGAGGRNPADRRHCCTTSQRTGTCLSLSRQTLRLRQQARPDAGQRRPRGSSP
jgi:UTP-glucose-1-phosphate uridylyltransferase